MQIEPHSAAKIGIATLALALFLCVTCLATWWLIGGYILAPEMAAVTFGDISVSHPYLFLANWSPAIAAFAVVFLGSGMSGIRAFLSLRLLWRCSVGWAIFIVLLLPLVLVAGSLRKGGLVLAPMPPERMDPVVAVLS